MLYEIVVAPSKLNCIVCLLHVTNREQPEENIGYEKHLHLREAHEHSIYVVLNGIAPHPEEPNALQQHNEGHLFVVGLSLGNAQHDDDEENGGNSIGDSHDFGRDEVGKSTIVGARKLRV